MEFVIRYWVALIQYAYKPDLQEYLSRTVRYQQLLAEHPCLWITIVPRGTLTINNGVAGLCSYYPARRWASYPIVTGVM